jgi:hypothetical protein
LTQILATRVRMVENFTVPRPAVTMRSDPYYGEFLLDKNAQSMLLFNARDVDAAGQALLMKAVLRMDPATEQKVAEGAAELDTKLAAALALLHSPARGDVNVTAGHLRAAIGLQSEESAANVPASIKQKYATAPWLTELTTLASAHIALKNSFIDANIGALQLDRYRRADPAARPDVELVGAKATYISTEDVHNTEFAFGDPLKQVSLDKAGKEISASVSVRPENINERRGWNNATELTGRRPNADVVTQGDELDKQPVKSFPQRLSLSLSANADTIPGAWLDDAKAASLDASVHMGRGVIFEPGAGAQLHFNDTVLGGISVAADDAQLLGNAPTEHNIDTKTIPGTLRSFLNEPLTLYTYAQAKKTDAQATKVPLINMVYPSPASIQVGSGSLSPLADVALQNQVQFAANKLALSAHVLGGEKACVTVRLEEGSLANNDDKATVKGFQVQTSVSGWRPSALWSVVTSQKPRSSASTSTACQPP